MYGKKIIRRRPLFSRPTNCLLGKQYSLILDLSHLLYDSETGTFSQSVSTSFDKWISATHDPSATLDVLVLPDERFFQAQRDSERVKQFSIDLNKLRAVRNTRLESRQLAFLNT